MVILICSLVLIGWQFDIEIFKRILPSFVAMNPLAAICFIASATGFLVVRTRPAPKLRQWEMFLLVSSVMVAATGVIARYITHKHFFLADRVLFSSKLDVAGQLPNYMAPNTAIGFIIIGLSLLLLNSRHKVFRRISQYLAGAVAFASSIAILGYLYGSQQPFIGFRAFIPIAVHSAICFILLSTAILMSRPREGLMSLFSSSGGAGFMMRRLLVPAVLLPTILGWLRIQGQRANLYNTDIGVSLTIATNILLGCILVWVAGYVLNKKEREIDQAKDEFLNLATHQLRTPVTSVKMGLSMLSDGTVGPMNEKQIEVVEGALVASERELKLVNDLLNVAKADAGRMILKKAQTNLDKLIRSVVNEQKTIIDARNQHIDVELSNIQAFIDPDRFRMAIENLISNASKYSADGGHIRIKAEEASDRILIEVVDNGVGMAPEDINKIFVKFTRLDNPLSKERGGTGLGIYLVQKIVELHGGNIRVESELGRGSKFTIELPG